MRLKNHKISIDIKDGIICKLYDCEDKNNTNLTMQTGSTGSISYTYTTDDITVLGSNKDFVPYIDRKNIYSSMIMSDNVIICRDDENQIITKYYLDSELVIDVNCNNRNISELAVNFDLNFMGMKGTYYAEQLLPTTPYTSANGKYMYYTMARPNGRFMTIAAETPADGWRIKYSEVSLCHYIDGIQFFASFDRQFGGSGRKQIKLRIFFSKNIEEVYSTVGRIYEAPYCINVISGGFGDSVIKCSSDTDEVKITAPSGKNVHIRPDKDGIITYKSDEYGLHMVTALKKGECGLNSTIWSGLDYDILFEKSCDAIKQPYHVDDNLCEGGMFLWAMLVYMNKTGSRKYDRIVQNELKIIMGENGYNVPRKTILPYPTDKFNAYHISDSDRIQEQFVGISILLEAYKLYKEKKYIDHAINALDELMINRISVEGMIFRYNEKGIVEDYTTVYAPALSIVDMAVYMDRIGDKRAKRISDIAVKIADFLVERNISFPTEGEVSDDKEPEMEDGSISCTALSVLYVYSRLKKDKKYLCFAEKILKLHDTWAILTPDARMYQSSFRWWETIWEGDGAGPAICAGHAWTIWRAEALYLYGIEVGDEESLIKSWNGFITNFAKIKNTGESYSCYEVDYIRGGGSENIRASLLQLQNENIAKCYKVAHDYPQHTDSSLSRYVWVRYEATWADTAAIINIYGKNTGINIEKKEGVWYASAKIKKLYIGNVTEKIIVVNETGETVIITQKNRLYKL